MLVLTKRSPHCRLSSIILCCWLFLFTVQTAGGLRCFVCGGHSGTPCRGGVGWASGDTPSHGGADTGGQDPVQECTDLINNRGCVKQFVNGGRRASLAVSSLSNTSLSCPLSNLINAL